MEILKYFLYLIYCILIAPIMAIIFFFIMLGFVIDAGFSHKAININLSQEDLE